MSNFSLATANRTLGAIYFSGDFKYIANSDLFVLFALMEICFHFSQKIVVKKLLNFTLKISTPHWAPFMIQIKKY